MHVCVIVGPALAADRGLVEEITTAALAGLSVNGRLVFAADTAGLCSEWHQAGGDPDCAVVLVPGDEAVTRQLLQASDARDGTSQAVWFDPSVTGPMERPMEAAAHGTESTEPTETTKPLAYIYGRGLWGLTWAIRHAVLRMRVPARRIRYGPHPDQWADLRLPGPMVAARPPDPAGAGTTQLPGSARTAQPLGTPRAATRSEVGRTPADPEGWPVVVLLHGGYWRSVWGADLMDALAIDLAERGFAVWNLEYRRPDLHGWVATTQDVADGLATLAKLATAGVDAGRRRADDVPRQLSPRDAGEAQLDLDRIAVIGHSAGGQLALRLAADDHRVALTVSLAGVLDLAGGARRGLSNGAVAAALGGSRAQRPETYAASDPMARLPIGVPLLIVQGRQDDLDLIDINRRFVRASRAAGDEVTYLEQAGDHFAVIDPASDLWQSTVSVLADRLRPARAVVPPTAGPGALGRRTAEPSTSDPRTA